MSYYGQYPFNTNGGSLFSKRNYINRKLDEIEQTLLQLGWIEPEQETYEEELNEYNLPVESAGALLPYRDRVNKRLDFFEEVINSHIGPVAPNNYTEPNTLPKQRYYTPEQEEVKKSFNESVNDLFG
jgi:hypothetical protein